MYNLQTKQQRQEARAGWINGRITEKYKDIEILKDDRNGKFTLTIWKGSAGNPCINYLYRDNEQRQQQIDYEEQRADRRMQYKEERAKEGKTKTTAALASAQVKKILTKEYPSIKFSVRCENYANGSSVNVSWIDGVPEKAIQSFVDQFQYGSFDGMTDCYNYTNVKDMPQAKYCFANREISNEKRSIIRKQLAEKMNIEDSEQAAIPKDYMVNVRGYNGTAPLSALVYQITRDFDFTKGFHGIKNQCHEGQEISNMFEVY